MTCYFVNFCQREAGVTQVEELPRHKGEIEGQDSTQQHHLARVA